MEDTNVVALITKIHSEGFILSVVDDALQCIPIDDSSVLTVDLKRKIRENKANIIDRLLSTPAPLSPGQARMLYINMTLERSAAYNVPISLELRGKLDIIHLSNVIKQICSQQKILCTKYKKTDESYCPYFQEPSGFDLMWNLIDANYINVALEAEIEKPFDLFNEIPIRFKLFKLSDNHHILLIIFHHICNDGWSLNIFFDTLTKAYTGSNNPFLPLNLQFQDYARWLADYRLTTVYANHLKYWQKKLNSAVPIVLPSDQNGSYTGVDPCARYNFTIKKPVSEALRAFVGNLGVTPFVSLLTLFNILLHWYTGINDITIGVPVLNRDSKFLQTIIGYFSNTLLVRQLIDPSLKFEELIIAMQSHILEDFEHQIVSTSDVLSCIRQGNLINETYPIPCLFAYQTFTLSDTNLKLDNITVQAEVLFNNANKAFLLMNIQDDPAGFSGFLEYDQTRYSETLIINFVQNFTHLIDELLKNPSAAIEDLFGLRPEELVRLNDLAGKEITAIDEIDILEQFETIVKTQSDKNCLESDGKAYSYQEVYDISHEYAFYLQSQLVAGKNSYNSTPIIAISTDDTACFVISILAILKINAIYVPLDLNLPVKQLRVIVENINPNLIMSHAFRKDLIQEFYKGKITLLDNIFNNSMNSVRQFAPKKGSSNLSAYIMLTSGTTGKPKSVIVPRGNIVKLVCDTNYFRPTKNDRMAQFANLAFDGSTFEIWGALLNGISLVCIPRHVKDDPQELSHFFQEYNISIAFIPTGYFLHSLKLKFDMYASLRCVYIGGDSLPALLCRQLKTKIYNNTRFYNAYGPTETVTFSTSYLINDKEAPDPEIMPIGKPITNRECYLFNSSGHRVPYGGVGEIHISGAIASGYLDDPTMTSLKFKNGENFGLVGRNIYATGDIGRFTTTGNLVLQGRQDRQIKRQGYRVELDAITNVMEGFQNVQQSYVLLRSTEGEAFLVLYVVPSGNQSIIELPQSIKLYISNHLPCYMVPDEIVIIKELPLALNGKVDVRQLILQKNDVLTQGVTNEKLTPNESKLRELWVDCLGHDQIALHSDFFNIGGHSLRLMHLARKIETSFDISVNLRHLFINRTLSMMSLYIENSKMNFNNQWDYNLHENKELNSTQQRIWFLESFAQTPGLYNIPFALRLSGDLDCERLKMALLSLIKRQAICSTKIITHGGRPYHEYELALLSFITKDFSSECNPESSAMESIWQESYHSFSLAKEPPLRIYLVKIGEYEYILLLLFHHIIADGWSLICCLNELSILYQDRVSKLPELTVSYYHYNQWLDSYADSNLAKRDLKYWKAQLETAPISNTLPYDFLPLSRQSYQGKHFQCEATKEQFAKLQLLARHSKTTLFTVLFGMFHLLLHLITKQTTIIVGTPLANRSLSGTELLIGYFANTVAIRSDIHPDIFLYAYLKQLHGCILDAIDHQYLPFEKILEALNLKRSELLHPIFQTWFYFFDTEDLIVDLGEIKSSLIPISLKVAKFDLTLSVIKDKDKLLITFEYVTDRFEDTTICEFAHKFIALIDNYSEEDIQLSRYLNIKISDCETLYDAFHNTVLKSPDHIALVHNSKKISYYNLEKYINSVAKNLRDLEVKSGDVVATLIPHSIEAVVVFLATLKIGAIYTPFDFKEPSDRLLKMCASVNAKIIVSLIPYQIKELQNYVFNLDAIINPKVEEVVPRASCKIAYIIHTSGSTGLPKPVACYHSSIFNLLKSINNLAPIDGIVAGTLWTQLTFDVSLYELSSTICTGGTLHILDGDIRLNEHKFFHYLHSHEIVSAYIPPFMLNSLWRWLQSTRKILALKRLLVGVESISEKLLYDLQSLLPNLMILNAYGPTEATVCCTLYRLPPYSDSMVYKTKTPIGKPVLGTTIHILDNDQSEVQEGEIGELYISGTALSQGYWHNDKLTKESFVTIATPHLIKAYRTGDLVSLNENKDLVFVGRKDSQIKLRGYRIEPMEIVNTLCSYPGILQAEVLIYKNSESTGKLVAFFVLEDVSITDREINFFLGKNLPSHLCPDILIKLDSLPINSHGKIDYNELLNHVASLKEHSNSSARSLSEKESILMDIWCSILHLPLVGVNDNFFELGGDSILAMQMVSYAKEKNIDVELRAVLNKPTISELALSLEENKPVTSKMQLHQKQDFYNLTPIQQWFFNQNFINPHHYNQSLLYQLKNSVDKKALILAIESVIGIYDVFIQIFRSENGAMRAKSVDFKIIYSDISLFDEVTFEEDKDVELRNYCNKINNLINYEQGPLFLVRLITNLTTRTSYFYLVAHHLVVDVVSWQNLIRELLGRYIECSHIARIEKSTVPYANWANNLYKEEIHKNFLPELAFWCGHAAQKSLPLPFIKDKSNEFCRLEWTIACVLPNSRASINEIALITIISALSSWLKESKIKVMLENHGRESILDSIDPTNSIGWFTSMYPVVFTVSQPSLINFINKEIKDHLSLIPHKGIGYGILRYIFPEESLINACIQGGEPNVLINYLGRLDERFTENDLFSEIVRTTSDDRAHCNLSQAHALEIVSYLKGNECIYQINFCDNILDATKVEALKDIILKSWNSQTALLINKNMPEDNLVVLREGGPDLFFMIHPIGGEIHWYRALSELLPPNVTVYGVQRSNLYSNNVETLSILELAQHYGKQLISKLQHPYCFIFGWSFGAVLGYEIIHYLEMQGIQVLQFYIIDQPMISAEKKDFNTHPLMVGDKSIQIDLQELIFKSPTEYLNEHFERGDFSKVFPEQNDSTYLFEYLLPQLVFIRSLVDFTPQHLLSNVKIIFSEESDKYYNKEDFYGWNKYIHGSPSIEIIPGNHVSIFNKSKIQNLAKILNEDLSNKIT